VAINWTGGSALPLFSDCCVHLQVMYKRICLEASPSKYHQENTALTWVKDLQRADVEFLRSLPYTISVPSYNIIVVHAGLVPGVPLHSQHSADMTKMRGLVKESDGSYTGTTSKAYGPWAASWIGPQYLFFGHNASRGLQKHPFAMGLDTGCVYGRQLTGAIVSSATHKPRLFSVAAQQVYSIPQI